MTVQQDALLSQRILRPGNLIILVLLLAAFTRFWRIETPNVPVFDESNYVSAATKILDGDSQAWDFDKAENTHPPLSKEIIAGGLAIFGENSPLGWRFFSAVAAMASVFFTYLLAKRLFNNECLAALAGFFIVVENLILVDSRLGLPDVFVQAFLMASLYFLVSDVYRASGACLGAAIACKWIALPGFLPVLFYFSMRFWERDPAQRKAFLKRMIVRLPLFFGMAPLAVYLLTYTPMLLSGRSVQHIWELNKDAYQFHRSQQSVVDGSSWYEWPLLTRPIPYWAAPLTTEDIQNHQTDIQKARRTLSMSYVPVAKIYGMGNPSIFWAGIPTLLFLLWRGRRWLLAQTSSSRSPPASGFGDACACLFVAASFLGLWIPWALHPRAMLLYHYLPELPLVCVSLAYACATGWRYRWGRPLVVAFIVLAVATFIYFYPHVAAVYVPRWLDQSYYWFPSWR